MLESLLGFAIRQRLLMVLIGVAIAALGILNYFKLPIDAVPDISNNQVQINTSVPGMTPQEVETQITFPIEAALSGLPDVQQTRSISHYGLSQGTVVFEDSVDIYRARQLVSERLVEAKANLPQGVGAPIMGPVATGLGEIYMYAVEATGNKPDGTPYTPTDLRTIQERVIKPQLRTVPGVTEVNSIGGFEKQYHVTPDPMKMLAFGVSFRDLLEALEANNANVGAGYIEHTGEQYLIRTTGLIQTLDDIRNIKVGIHDGVPFFIHDVATVQIGNELRTGAATLGGKETVIGTAIMLIGENSRVVSKRVNKRLAEVNRTLPEGVRATTLYDRTFLVDATLHTVSKNLIEGALLVIVILFLLLGNIRAAFIVALAIPLSMLFAITGMVQGKISGNLMSLGAIDFGLIVDSSVILIENIMRRLAERQHQLGRLLTKDERIESIKDASIEVRKPTLFGELIIAIVYLPILTLTGIEGKMFVPMAQVVLLALLGALFLSFTFIPALAALILRGRFSEKEIFIVRWAKVVYQPVVAWSLKLRWVVLGLAVVLIASCGWLATRLGSEFTPKLREGAFTIEGARIPSIALMTSVAMECKVEELLAQMFPDEIAAIFSRTGTAEVATDPQGPNASDIFIILKPQSEWKKARTTEELADLMEREYRRIPGENGDFLQPIEMRMNEMISGIKSDVAIKVYGDNMETMLGYANKIASIVRKIKGAADIKVEQVTGLPVVTIDIDRKAIARFGLNVKDVQDVVRTAMGGTQAGQVVEGDRRFDLVVRLPENIRQNLAALKNLPIPLPKDNDSGVPIKTERSDALAFAGRASARISVPGYLPLSSVARIEVSEGPKEISRENGKRRIVVKCNVRGTDIGTFVEEAQKQIDKQIGHMPEGYWIGWGGQFESLIAARQRLSIVVPVALGLILMLLFATFNSFKHSLLVFSGVPLALTGGVLALWLRSMPFSISAGVGFIALSGVAVLNGMVMMTFINQLRAEGKALRESIVQGSLLRLRPVLMTALVASLGFVPMAIAQGMGSEVQRPLATVVIGGIISATLLTLIVLPVLYYVTSREGSDAAVNE